MKEAKRLQLMEEDRVVGDRKHDEKAAFGLLRLIYHNNITLFGFPREMLIKFQE